MPAVIEVTRVWKRYRIHEFKTVYGRAAQWPRLVRELLVPASALAPDGQFWALRDVSVEVGRGEVLGLIGPNGAGKTTLLRLIGGISRPTRGDVRVRGRIGALISVGAGFHPELTGRENIYLNGAIMGMSRQEIERKFDSIVDFAEIADFLNTPLKRYSSGMSVKLGFAIAAHLEPDVLLVDEILSVGDVRFRRKSYERMVQLFRSGVTIVFVSHSMRMVERLCDRAVLLNRGAVVYAGQASDVVNYYLNELVAAVRSPRAGGRLPDVAVAGVVLLEGVDILAGDHEGANELKFGADATIQLRLRLLEDVASYLKCVLTISTVDDIILATLWSPAFEGLRKGRHAISCRLQNLSLLPGAYRLDLRLNVDGKAHDWPLGELLVKTDIKYSARQDAAAESQHHSELIHLRSYMHGQGVIFVPHSWECAADRRPAAPVRPE